MGRNFRNIKAWQYADDLTVSVHSKTKSFPKEELYGITSQLMVSVPTNIVEGASREHKKEYLYFLNIARGSIAEAEYLLYLSRQLGYLKENDYKEVEELRKETAKTLYGLVNSVKKEVEKNKD